MLAALAAHSGRQGAQRPRPVSGPPPAVRSGVGVVDVESFTCLATPGGKREHLPLIELLGNEKPLFFEASECWVDRTRARPPSSRTADLELGDHLIAVHGSLGQNAEQGVSYRPAVGPLRPTLARTASLTHGASSFLVVRVWRHPPTTPGPGYEEDSDISLSVKRQSGGVLARFDDWGRCFQTI